MIPDFVTANSIAAGDSSKKQGELTWLLRVQAFAAKQEKVHMASKCALQVLAGSEVRMANKYYELALGRALQLGCHLSLATFLIEQPTKPLQATEERCYGEGHMTQAGYIEQRVCIKDLESGTCKYELPRNIISLKLFYNVMRVMLSCACFPASCAFRICSG